MDAGADRDGGTAGAGALCVGSDRAVGEGALRIVSDCAEDAMPPGCSGGYGGLAPSSRPDVIAGFGGG